MLPQGGGTLKAMSRVVAYARARTEQGHNSSPAFDVMQCDVMCPRHTGTTATVISLPRTKAGGGGGGAGTAATAAGEAATAGKPEEDRRETAPPANGDDSAEVQYGIPKEIAIIYMKKKQSKVAVQEENNSQPQKCPPEPGSAPFRDSGRPRWLCTARIIPEYYFPAIRLLTHPTTPTRIVLSVVSQPRRRGFGLPLVMFWACGVRKACGIF